MRRLKSYASVILLFISLNSYSHQPVMDIAPRWEDGYGIQLRHENFGSDELIDGGKKAPNLNNAKVLTNLTWLEGVYSFKRSLRATFKLPTVNKSYRSDIEKTDISALGDLILGMPYKRYSNKNALTYNWSVTPSIRVPTSSKGSMAINDGSTDLGLSFSFQIENPKIYFMADFWGWKNNTGRNSIKAGDQLGLDLNLGYNFLHENVDNKGLFFIWDASFRKQNQGVGLGNSITGGDRIHTGPVLVFFKNNAIFRAEYKLPVEESFHSSGLSRGAELNIGIGFTF